ncbi:hypothetical protein HF325_003055 [Metschnikowia pulcherrima]|uniref:Protein kinase domain-containing protein n=1 Tax=Metschnikowia pulcherrima TaxID=27326 RepID=A0A8H7GQZ3_9ASCO|nr:hypothetical protein HF325_003055 [Metschnikowia pulcherrima]
MNFLSSALNLISVNTIPYTFKEKIVDPSSSSYPENRSIWTIYDGINPKNESPVSIFEFSLKDPKTYKNTQLAKNCFKKLKLVKFPGILGVLDFIENDSFLYIISERITPLAQYLQNHTDRISKDAKLYGIYNITKALAFINTKANCLHGSLDISSSIFVNAQGEWKLFGFELLTNLSSDPDQPIYRLSGDLPGFDENLPPEVAEGGADAIRGAPFKFDAYRLALFVVSLFSLTDFHNPYIHKGRNVLSAQERTKLPRPLASLVTKLIAQHQSRITAEDFARESEGFFVSNKLVKFSHVLDEIKFENQASKLTSGLPADRFSKIIKPIIFSSFSLSDRAIRLILLKYLPEFRDRLTDVEVQTKVFINLLTGLQDTNFLIRETTLTSITSIIEKVSVKQVNQDLLKMLAKLQMDPKPSIRTNTLILIINISAKIYSNSRNSVVITALAKSLRDTFTPCKLAALSGFERLIETFSLEEICSKILGQLAVSLMDPKSFKVRQESKRIFDLYLDSVEKHAASLPQDEEDQDAEEKEFYKASAIVLDNIENTVPEPRSSLSIGWSVVNRLVASDVNPVKGTLEKAVNTSTPDLTRTSSPHTAQQASHGWDEALDDDGQWEDQDGLTELMIDATVPRFGSSTILKAKSQPVPRTSISDSN